LRKDTLSHAYELMKVADPKKRRKLAAQVASGELSLVKLRQRIEGRRAVSAVDDTDADDVVEHGPPPAPDPEVEAGWESSPHAAGPVGDDSLVTARHHLAEAVEDLVAVLRAPDVMRSMPDVDRANLAKYLTIAKLKLENAIAVVRTSDGG
jgi:hypothetical protein